MKNNLSTKSSDPYNYDFDQTYHMIQYDQLSKAERLKIMYSEDPIGDQIHILQKKYLKDWKI